MATATQRIVDALGGPETLDGDPENLLELHALVREGLSYRAFEAARDRFGLQQGTVAELFDIPLRTLSRRRKEQKLRADESDRVVRWVRIATSAVEVLGSAERAMGWLSAPNRALGGAVPNELLETDLGAHEVEAVLGRLERGVFS